MLPQKCLSLLSEWISAPHYTHSSGNFCLLQYTSEIAMGTTISWDDLWCFFGPMCNPKASSYPAAEIVGSRFVESSPSCCRAERTTYFGKLDSQQDLTRNPCTDGCLSHPLQSQIDWNGSSIFAALCSVLSCDSHWKWPKQKPWTEEARRASFFPTLNFPANFNEFPAPELRFWTVVLNFWTSFEYGARIVSQFISSTPQHAPTLRVRDVQLRTVDSGHQQVFPLPRFKTISRPILKV